ncbi:uncharacterized protein LOC132639719 [Lycium barbarum]|uniref:uncharacterized protein LOC132639719 n=1 Tax=Lycium barbarum TaxID=112863 RepID=UPI00293E8AFC|nr:uncharacterized protein LOC132639719 [Lycium barbarum]
MVTAVFNGKQMPKYFTNTCLILILKVDSPQEFSEFRPISLSNVTQKIVSKVMNNRISKIITKLISQNQSGFVKGKPIGENVLLAQELIHDLKKYNKGKSHTLKLVLDCLKNYEKASGQIINKEKSCFLMDSNISNNRINIVSQYLQVQRKEFPINYLGCPFFQGREKIEYFTQSATKILKKLGTWHCNMLSKRGKKLGTWHCNMLSTLGIELVASTLATMPVYLLSICQPPKSICQQMEKNFASFLWGTADCKNKHHWVAWRKMCYPTEEGGIGIRSLQSVSNNFGAKLWWSYRTKKSLWSDFLNAKYTRRIQPVAKKWSYTQSHCWRRLMKSRDKVDQLILWKVNKGNSSFWWDNWTGQGRLAQYGNANTSVTEKCQITSSMMGGILLN